jgi:hypothetical protein
LRGPAPSLGDLVVDNGTTVGRETVLPSFGGGTAQAGSTGALLVTDRTTDIRPYFEGHWVEVSDALGTLKGTWRIASIASVSFTLEPNGAETIDIVEGDTFQGVYRFDSLLQKSATVSSGDPIRVAAELALEGVVAYALIESEGDLVLRAGAVLKMPAAVADPQAPGILRLDVGGTLRVEPGAVIDVSAQGHAGSTSYPGAALPGTDSGGSHLGEGGVRSAPAGETYGSVCGPREAGAGGQSGPRGGGVLRIVAGELVNDGAIRANGAAATGSNGAGAGGSIWISVLEGVSGAGTIEANGAAGSNYYGTGSGGGGALAIDYGTAVDAAQQLRALGGVGGSRHGGAGTICLRGPAPSLGDLIVDNGTTTNGRSTVLPALGSGTAQAGSTGALLVTDRTTDIRPYFVGHWVEVSDAVGTLKGTWRIASIAGVSFTLEPNDVETIDIVEGDTFQGVYRFDSVTTSNATLVSADPIRDASQQLRGPAQEGVAPNESTPSLDADSVGVLAGSVPGAYRIVVDPQAFRDPDGISELLLTDGERRQRQSWSPARGVSFEWFGSEGDRLRLVALDAHHALRLGAELALPALGSGDAARAVPNGVARVILPAGERVEQAARTDAGMLVGGRTVRLFDRDGRLRFEVPPLDDADAVVALGSGGGWGVIGRRDRVELFALEGDDERVLQLATHGEVESLAVQESGAWVLVRDGARWAVQAVRFTGGLDGLELEPAVDAVEALPEGARPASPLLAFGDDGLALVVERPEGTYLTSLDDPAGTTTPEPGLRLEPGTRALAGPGGIALVHGSSVRLLGRDFGPDGPSWRTVIEITAPSPILDGDVGTDRIALALADGSIVVYSWGETRAPLYEARIPAVGASAVRWLHDGRGLVLYEPGSRAPLLVLDEATWTHLGRSAAGGSATPEGGIEP